MLAIVKETNLIVDVIQDADDKNHFYEEGENGRLISDYEFEDLEFVPQDSLDLKLTSDVHSCPIVYTQRLAQTWVDYKSWYEKISDGLDEMIDICEDDVLKNDLIKCKEYIEKNYD